MALILRHSGTAERNHSVGWELIRHSGRHTMAGKLSDNQLTNLLRAWKAVGSDDAALLQELARAKQRSLKLRKTPGAKKKDDHARFMVAAVVCVEAIVRNVHPKTALRKWLRHLYEELRHHPDALKTFGVSHKAAADRLWDQLREPDVFTDPEWELICHAAQFRARHMTVKEAKRIWDVAQLKARVLAATSRRVFTATH
jgi:hypothetical protein